MLVPNQKVKTTWTHANRKYYETLGYYFTEYYDEIYVKPDDLPITSKVKVNVTCDGDNCYELFCIPYFNYTKSIEKYNKYLCKTCATRYGINLKRISNIPNRYEKFISWCEKYEYSPISKKMNVKVTNQFYIIDVIITGHKVFIIKIYTWIEKVDVVPLPKD